MKSKLILSITLCFALLRMNSQTYKEKFNALVDANDTISQEKLLKDWKKAAPNDAEVYTAGFNYYVRKSMKPAPGKTRGEMLYSQAVLKTAYALVDTGVARFPDRLDMRFGKIYTLGETKNYDLYTKEIIKAIDYSNIIKNNWKWVDNAPVKDDKKKFFLGSVQEYINTMLNTKNGNLLDYVRQISEEVIRYYPDEVEFICNNALSYMLREEFDNALKIFQKAEKISPHSSIVISNIATCYMEKGDSANAIKYYELVKEYGDESDKNTAIKMLQELKSQ